MIVKETFRVQSEGAWVLQTEVSFHLHMKWRVKATDIHG
jgi:hypothetical protein